MEQTLDRLALSMPEERELEVLQNAWAMPRRASTFRRWQWARSSCWKSSRTLPSEPEPQRIGLLPDEEVGTGQSYTIEVLASDRQGLLLDITTYLNNADIPLVANSGRILPETRIAFDLCSKFTCTAWKNLSESSMD